MTANIVVDLTTTKEFRDKVHTPTNSPDIVIKPIADPAFNKSHIPVIWILHEWWTDEMITSNLRIRNIDSLTLSTVKMALQTATKIVFVSQSQKKLYSPTAPSEVIYVGVPRPPTNYIYPNSLNEKYFTILVLGIVCPRKNQLWAIEIFKNFKKSLNKRYNNSDIPHERQRKLKLLIVGARYIRDYEISYVEKVKEAMKDDKDIELHEVTDTVDKYYSLADCLLVTSINEVTPMVLPEAMSRSIPVLSTNIAGIPELFNNNEGFIFPPYDTLQVVDYLCKLYDNNQLCKDIGNAGRLKYESSFTLVAMVDNYKKLIFEVAPPVILIDMDGVLVNWDKGFYNEWTIELALRGVNFGFDVYICTTPILSSHYCMNEKVEWIRNNLGDIWVNKMILCVDKTAVNGDILIDDKPLDYLDPNGKHRFANWKQIVFDAPYNKNVSNTRLKNWSNWKEVLLPLLSISTDSTKSNIQSKEKVNDQLFADDFDLNEELKVNIPILGVNQWESERMKQAQEILDCFLGPLDDILSPEDVASIAGSSSLLDNNDIDNLIDNPDVELSQLTSESIDNIQKKASKVKEHKKQLEDSLKAQALASGDMSIPPIMCFDFGSLGFLAPFKYADFEEEVDQILAGHIKLTLRMRLDCKIYRNNTLSAVIDRGPSPFLTTLDLACDSEYLTTVQGDGIIIATPTGSTAYSLAAGGSMVHPSIPAILITPICAHTLSFRPLILPDSSVLTCFVPYDARGTGWVCFDGKYRLELQRGERMEVKMSPYPMPTMNRLSFTGDWFGALRSQFMFNLRPRQKGFNS
eukprot:gene20789-26949_t